MESLSTNQHIKSTIALSLPLIATQIGHVLTGIVDNYFLGQLGKTELAAGISANGIFVLLLVFMIGMSYASTPLVSAAHINNDLQAKASLFKNSVFREISIIWIITPFMKLQ